MTSEMNESRPEAGKASEEIRLKDITWGGRIRVDFQYRGWEIAANAACATRSSYSGTMVASSQTSSLMFLDGGVSDTRGEWGWGGMFWSGLNAKAYILYELGLDPRKMLRRKSIPSHEELRAQVEEDKRRAAAEREQAGKDGPR